ncbi:MAG: YbaB/EbfC family nucleoid-associated protein [Alphaproteobacteria bacterium]
MKNLGKLMKQAQEMQGRMADMQEALSQMEATGESGGGMVKATVNGKGEALRMRIDPSLLTPAEREMVEDLVVAAINDARRKAEVLAAEEMSKLTGGLELPPGVKLPF